MHYRELRREVRLLALAHEADYPLAKTLSDLFGSLDRDLREGIGAEQIETRAGRPASHDRPAGAHAADRPRATIGRFIELLDLADDFCREERLLSLARTPEQRRFQSWFLGEFVRQAKGEAAAGVARRTRAGPHQRRVTAVARTAAGRGGRGGRRRRRRPALGLGEVVPDGAGFPWTTFAINVVGCVRARRCCPPFAVGTPHAAAGARARARAARRVHHPLGVRRAGPERCSPTGAPASPRRTSSARWPPAWSPWPLADRLSRRTPSGSSTPRGRR